MDPQRVAPRAAGRRRGGVLPPDGRGLHRDPSRGQAHRQGPAALGAVAQRPGQAPGHLGDTLDTNPSSNPQPFHPQPSNLRTLEPSNPRTLKPSNSHPSTLNSQLSNPQPSTLNPRTLNLQPPNLQIFKYSCSCILTQNFQP